MMAKNVSHRRVGGKQNPKLVNYFVWHSAQSQDHNGTKYYCL